ncbi:unnamed protein product [Peronospora belbahrii]|uniref:Uncharacterized protein n=1 Tax=Peronospora belbahrii TaxID=622444 RepID=A0AAU9LC93_9STRA|nr:unnamed protein product [Peronospora belbahrii]
MTHSRALTVVMSSLGKPLGEKKQQSLCSPHLPRIRKDSGFTSMGNKGSKGAKSLRPPIKSDSRGFKFGNYSNGGRDAGKSAPAAPSYPSNGPSSVPGQPHSQQQTQQQSQQQTEEESDLEEDDSGPIEQVPIEDMDGPARPQTKPVDSVVTTTMSETQRNKAQFPGFTYNADTIDEDHKGN